MFNKNLKDRVAKIKDAMAVLGIKGTKHDGVEKSHNEEHGNEEQRKAMVMSAIDELMEWRNFLNNELDSYLVQFRSDIEKSKEGYMFLAMPRSLAYVHGVAEMLKIILEGIVGVGTLPRWDKQKIDETKERAMGLAEDIAKQIETVQMMGEEEMFQMLMGDSSTDNGQQWRSR